MLLEETLNSAQQLKLPEDPRIHFRGGGRPPVEA